MPTAVAYQLCTGVFRLKVRRFHATRLCPKVTLLTPPDAYFLFSSPGRGLPFGIARQCAGFTGPISDNKPQHQFKVLNRDLAYSGWRKIVKKTIRVEDDKDYVFDVVHQVWCVKELPSSFFLC